MPASIIKSFQRLVATKGISPKEKEAAFWDLVTTKPRALNLHHQALNVLQEKWPKRGQLIANQYHLRDLKKK
jgi:hypothetical protein